VVLLARRVERLPQLASELGPSAVAIAADVTDRDAIVAAADQVRRDLGRVDALVNNAGVMLLGRFGTEQRQEARRMVEVTSYPALCAQKSNRH
jgi:NADP-dependent 3-hydroxy acid dehydrogenase YdfG